MNGFKPTVALALHDLLPVTVAAVAMVLLFRAVRVKWTPASWPFGVGAALVVIGGLGKAGGKLIGAVSSGPPPALLDEALFPLLAPGMLVAGAAASATAGSRLRGRLTRSVAFGIPIVVWVVTLGMSIMMGWDTAKVLLIVLGTVGNVWLAVALIRWCRSEGQIRSAWLFAANLLIVVGLAGMARAVEQTVGWQWVEQNVNLAGQLAFLTGSYWLLRAATPEYSPVGEPDSLGVYS